MPDVELANTTNAVAIYSQPETLKEKINEWIQTPSSYDDQAQSFLAQSINRYACDTINDIISFVNFSNNNMLRAIVNKHDRDIGCLKLKLSLIAKSFGCGSLSGLAAAQIATQMTAAMAIASCATPAGWIGGTGTALVYYHFDKQDQKDKIHSKALLDIEKTDRVAEKIISSLVLGRSETENSRLNRVNEYLHDRNNILNAQLSGIGRDFKAARNQIDQLNSARTRERAQITQLQASLNDERGRITTLQTTQANLQNHNTNLNTQLDTARNRITGLEGAQTTANNQLATAQTRISSLDNNVAALQQQNQNLRTDLATNQTNLIATAARIDELQTQNALNLTSVQKMNRDLINEMRAEFQDRERANALKQEDRERSVAAKQIVERGIEKALRQEQENKISKLTSDLIRKSAAFEVLQSEHDHMSDQIKHRFDIMTQAMSRNPTESSVSELLRSTDQQYASETGSENNGDFIEVAGEM